MADIRRIYNDEDYPLVSDEYCKPGDKWSKPNVKYFDWSDVAARVSMVKMLCAYDPSEIETCKSLLAYLDMLERKSGQIKTANTDVDYEWRCRNLREKLKIALVRRNEMSLAGKELEKKNRSLQAANAGATLVVESQLSKLANYAADLETIHAAPLRFVFGFYLGRLEWFAGELWAGIKLLAK